MPSSPSQAAVGGGVQHFGIAEISLNTGRVKILASRYRYPYSPPISLPRSASPHTTSHAQISTAQHSSAQLSTAQHRTAQHSTAQHSTAQHCTAQHSQARPSSAQSRSDQIRSCLPHSSDQPPRSRHDHRIHSPLIGVRSSTSPQSVLARLLILGLASLFLPMAMQRTTPRTSASWRALRDARANRL